jgi:glycosyltransferase involved in cell wall biosynthesis
MHPARVLVDLGILATQTRARGIGRYVAELARGLSAQSGQASDIELHFLEGFAAGGKAIVSRDAEAAIQRLSAAPIVSRARWAYPIRLFAGRAAHDVGAGLLHLPAPGVTPLARGGALRVVTCHDLIPYRHPDRYATLGEGFSWGRRALDRRRYRSADHVIAISRASGDDVAELLRVPREKISVVLSGIDAARWDAAPAPADTEHLRELGLSGKRFLMYVGDGDWRKNSEGMLQALALARRSDPELALAWVGKLDAGNTRRIRREAETSGVTQGLELLGYVSDPALQAMYRAALGTLFVSRLEGFGYPVLEAMATGCPVITSNVSSMPEVAGDAALLVDPESPARIAEAILLLASEPERREALRRRGLERALTFSLAEQARSTLAVYRRLLHA